jgi:ribosomal protein L17
MARDYVERLVTLALQVRKRLGARDHGGALRARRAMQKLLGDRSLIPKEHQSTYDGMSDAHRARSIRMPSGRRHRTGEPKGRLVFTAESVVHRLIEKIAPRYADRQGGYTRLTHLGSRRVGDHTPEALLQLVGGEVAPVSLTKPLRSARERRSNARYSFAIKLSKAWATKERGGRKADGPKESGGTAPESGDEVTESSG